MRLWVVILMLIGATLSNYHFTIYLNKGESFTYDAVTTGPTLFNVTCSGVMDVLYEWDHFRKICVNATSCDKYYENYCHDRFSTTITMTSNTNRNEITLFYEENIGCNWIHIYWIWMTFLIIICLCCFLTICFVCIYKRHKLTSNDTEMIPLVDME